MLRLSILYFYLTHIIFGFQIAILINFSFHFLGIRHINSFLLLYFLFNFKRFTWIVLVKPVTHETTFIRVVLEKQEDSVWEAFCLTQNTFYVLRLPTQTPIDMCSKCQNDVKSLTMYVQYYLDNANYGSYPLNFFPTVSYFL